MRALKYWHIDAFTNVPFKGNPAAVYILSEPLEDDMMQAIAIEMNLSETAFVLLREGQNPLLRWFTPMFEIDLCGHATIASAQVYFSEFAPDAAVVTFDTKFVGPLTVQKNERSYTMNFPARPGETVSLNTLPAFITQSLSATQPAEARKARDLMLVYENEQTVLEMEPDFRALRQYDGFIIATAPSSNPQFDFISRFFCSSDGISEDPVTGSAHCTLAPYWAKKLNKSRMTAYQASSRGGVLLLELQDDRLNITGEAVTLMEGTLKVPS